MAMTKSERSELKSLVKARLKVLRADVEARRAELAADLQRSIHTKMAGEDQLWANITHGLGELQREFSRRVNDLLREQLGRDRWPNDMTVAQVQQVSHIRATAAMHAAESTPNRPALAQAGLRDIDELVKKANRELDRLETELLTELTVGALESDEAKAFLGRIPTVGELVPAERLREIMQ